MLLLSKVGGASGPLYGSFFIKMGKDAAGKVEVSFSEFSDMLKMELKLFSCVVKLKLGIKP